MRLFRPSLFWLLGILCLASISAGNAPRVFWLVYRNYESRPVHSFQRTFLMQFDSNGSVRMPPQEILSSLRGQNSGVPIISYRIAGSLNFYFNSRNLIRAVTDKTLNTIAVDQNPYPANTAGPLTVTHRKNGNFLILGCSERDCSITGISLFQFGGFANQFWPLTVPQERTYPVLPVAVSTDGRYAAWIDDAGLELATLDKSGRLILKPQLIVRRNNTFPVFNLDLATAEKEILMLASSKYWRGDCVDEKVHLIRVDKSTRTILQNRVLVNKGSVCGLPADSARIDPAGTFLLYWLDYYRKAGNVFEEVILFQRLDPQGRISSEPVILATDVDSGFQILQLDPP